MGAQHLTGVQQVSLHAWRDDDRCRQTSPAFSMLYPVPRHMYCLTEFETFERLAPCWWWRRDCREMGRGDRTCSRLCARRGAAAAGAGCHRHRTLGASPLLSCMSRAIEDRHKKQPVGRVVLQWHG